MTTSTLSKSDLIKQIAETTGLRQSDVTVVLDEFGAIVRGAVDVGTTVKAGFGRFVPGTRAARTGRNPRTGEPVEIAAKTTVSFKLAKAGS